MKQKDGSCLFVMLSLPGIFLDWCAGFCQSILVEDLNLPFEARLLQAITLRVLHAESKFSKFSTNSGWAIVSNYQPTELGYIEQNLHYFVAQQFPSSLSWLFLHCLDQWSTLECPQIHLWTLLPYVDWYLEQASGHRVHVMEAWLFCGLCSHGAKISTAHWFIF